jgi:hypothetical protein
VIGAVVGGVAASWKGIDGLVVATVVLLVVGILALANLRAHEGVILATTTGSGGPASIRDAIRDTLGVAGGEGPRVSDEELDEALKEKR